MTGKTMKRSENRAKLRGRLSEKQIDIFLVSSEVNVGYLTGFTGSDSVVLVSADRQVLVTDFRYVEQAQSECADWEVLDRAGQSLAKCVGEFVGENGGKRVGLEADHLSWQQYLKLSEAAPTAQLKPTIGLIEELRAVKSAWEVERIRKALAVAEDAFEELRSRMLPGVSEKQLADELEGLLRGGGATGSGFESIVAIDSNASLPHARPGLREMGERSEVLVDWGARVEGYNSDLTRVVVGGRVTSKFEELYRVVLEAQQAGIEAVKPGAKASDVDGSARGVIGEAGYGERFGHGLGHGVGLEVHEAPTLSSKSGGVLVPGMVVTIEPGIYIPGWGGIRIEDMVLVTESGHEVLSSLAKGLDSVTLS